MLKLKMRSFLYAIPYLCICLICIIIGLRDSMYWIRPYVEGTIDINDIDYSEQMTEVYVSGKLNEIYGCYLEEYDKGVMLTAKEYIMKADDTHFIGLRIKDRYEQTEKLMELSLAQLQGADNGTEVEAAKYEIIGVLKEMPSDSQFEYLDVIDYYDLSEEQKEAYLIYYIELVDVKDDIIMCLLMALIGLVIAIFILVYILRGKCQKDIYTCIKKSHSPAFEKEKIECFLAGASYIHNLQYDNYFLRNKRGAFTTFMRTHEVVKIYKKTKVVKYKVFIPIFKDCQLVFVTADGRERTIDFVREKHMDEALKVLREVCPYAKI